MKSKYLILPILFALLLGGCTLPFLGKTVEDAKQTMEQKAAEQAILKDCKYDQDICKYMAAQIGAFQSGITMTSITIKAGQTQVVPESVITMDGQGNMQIVSMEAGKETGNMISFNKATYIKDYDDGKWLKMTTDDEPLTSTFDVESTVEELKSDMKNEEFETIYTKIGTEACGNLTCNVYEMYQKDSPEDKTKLWVDTKEHLTRKMEMAIADGQTNIINYSYGPVTITEPSPVKEFTMPSVDTGNGQMPSQADYEKMMEEFSADDSEE